MINDLNLTRSIALKMSHPLLAKMHDVLLKIKNAFKETPYKEKTNGIIRTIEMAYVKTANGTFESVESEESNGERLSAKQKRALETATIAEQSTNNATVVSSADGAKVQNNLEILADNYEKRPNKTRGFITDLSKSLGLVQHEASQYGTFETRNGKLVTIRVSNHNARVSFFDENGEENGISIVISSHKNKGMLNDGKAHLVEYFYPKQSIERSESKPLADIVKCVSNALDSGKFDDTTGIAQRQEVNMPNSDENVLYSLRQKPEPEKKGTGYKVFVLGKDGKLYPPMVANPNGAATPVGVWLDADAAPVAGESKTGRPQVKQGGKGTQGGSGKLAYRPGWHLGVIPYAIQFNRKDAEGNKTLFPKNFVFAEVEYAADKDYQDEAHAEGINSNGKYQHSLAGLKHLPTDGYYMYRTNPNPETDPWVITGAMKVNRLLTRAEQADIVRNAGREPQKIQEGDIVTDDVVNSINQEIAAAPKFSLKVYHGSGADFTEFDFDHMGEGAGSQSFGWGGYVTSSKKIGKSYADLNRVRNLPEDIFDTENKKAAASYVQKLITQGYDKESAIQEVRSKYDGFLDNLNHDDTSRKNNGVAILNLKERIATLDEIEEGKLPLPTVSLYEVDIPDDNGSNYLEWEKKPSNEVATKIIEGIYGLDDKTLDDMAARDIVFRTLMYDYIKNADKEQMIPILVKTNGLTRNTVYDNGNVEDDMRFVYNRLSNWMGSQKAASKFLSSLGFTGIKYPAGTIYGGAEESDVNYVIFKPEDMQIVEHEKFSVKSDVDNQGNPLNQDGTLKLEKIKSVDELTDEDFLHPTRNVELPSLPKKIADAIGTEGKPVVIKKNIFERNYMRHKDVTPELSKKIFKSALYNPDLYGQNQKKTRPYNWVLINTKDEKGNNRTVLLEVNPNKDNVEIVHWHFIDERGLKKIRKQVDREDGQLLILPSDKEEVGALSDPTVNLSAANIANPSETSKGNAGKFSLRLQDAINETDTEPTEAQKKSGNYKKGHVKFGGYDYTIENPKGSYRSGVDENGKEWKQKMNDTYGYIRGKFGKDGDHLDMFINDNADLDSWNGDVYVVDQVNQDGTFDEHKVMYGYDSLDEAKKAYLSNYEKGWTGLGNITPVSKAGFDKWLDKSNRKLKPFADYADITSKTNMDTAPSSFEEFLEHPAVRYSIRNEKERAAAEDAYNFAQENRPDRYSRYAIVNMEKPGAVPQYLEKKVVADNWRRYYNKLKWGNYKLFDLDKPFEDNVKNLVGKFPETFRKKNDTTLSKINELTADYNKRKEEYDAMSNSIQELLNGLMKQGRSLAEAESVIRDWGLYKEMDSKYQNLMGIRKQLNELRSGKVADGERYLLIGKKDAANLDHEEEVSTRLSERFNESNDDIRYSLKNKDRKQAQLDIILKTNPMLDDYHTGIRKVEDIKTLGESVEEARSEAEKYGDDEWSAYPDITNDMLQNALETGEITIYSSKPIKNGVFVTPSYMQASDYAGGGNVYEKTVPLTDVAWINTDEGQYAKVDGERYSLKEVNDKFNDRLAQLIENPNQKDRVLHLGRSSQFLIDGGIADAEIELDFDKFVRKSSEKYKNNHPFSAGDIKDLPKAIAHPVAVFNSTTKKDHVVMTELNHDGKNFIVAIRATEQNRKNKVVLEVNQITSLYPKGERGIIYWINNNKLSNVDKEKALHFIEALQPHAGTLTSEELSSAANIVRNFVNPKQNDGNLQKTERYSLRVDRYRDELNQWKKDNNLPKDAERPQLPVREPNDRLGFT